MKILKYKQHEIECVEKSDEIVTIHFTFRFVKLQGIVCQDTFRRLKYNEFPEIGDEIICPHSFENNGQGKINGTPNIEIYPLLGKVVKILDERIYYEVADGLKMTRFPENCFVPVEKSNYIKI